MTPDEVAGDSWYFSNCLQQRYGVRHFVAAPTVVAKATDAMLSRLARHGTTKGTKGRMWVQKVHQAMQNNSTMWVQTVRQAPAPKLFATCRDRFANAQNFRGEPHLPGNDLLTRYPGAG